MTTIAEATEQIINSYKKVILDGKLSEDDLIDLQNRIISQMIKILPSEMEEEALSVIKMRTLINKESDRGASLYISAYLDVRLENLLKAFFVEDKRVIDEMFIGNGPLATFSSRINVAYALGFIDKQTKNDIDLIRKIRNTFAHSSENIDFNDRKISQQVSSIEFFTLNKNDKPRSQYIAKCMSIIGHINSTAIKIERRKFSGFSPKDLQQLLEKPTKHESRSKKKKQ